MSLRAGSVAAAALATASFLLAPSTSHPVQAIGTKLR
jgi:hypothetical protein